MRACLALSTLLLAGVAAGADDKKSTPVPPPNLGLHLLIVNEAVQQELKLNNEQKKSCEEISTEAREGLRGLRNLNREERQKKTAEVRQKVEAKLEKLFKEEQNKRLRQIDLQQRGPLALSQKKNADEVELTPEQRKQLRELSQKVTQDVAKLREDGARGAELAERSGKLRLEACEKVFKLLTEEQKKSWQKLVGQPFDLSKLSGAR